MKYAIFLRGMNLGKRRVKMVELAQIISEAGYRKVQTYLASGNIVAETDQDDPVQVESHIEQVLKAALGYEVATFVRSHEELAALPSFGEEWTAIHVMFFKESLMQAQRDKLLSLQTPGDTFEILGRDVFWLCRSQISQSALFDVKMDKVIAVNTARNQNTLRQMIALTGEPG